MTSGTEMTTSSGIYSSFRYIRRMKKFGLAWAFVKYLFAAKTKHDIHSPFVFHFITDVLENRKTFYAFEEIEMLRLFLLHSTDTILVEDFGAGSHVLGSSQRRVSDIAKTNLITKKHGQLLFRMVNYFHAKNILEIGTSLGISTLYLAKSDQQARVITLEGSISISDIAKSNFRKTGAQNIEILTGEFGSTLPAALQKISSADLIFLDGNHRKEPTLAYFNMCLSHCHEQTVMVFDDIHWSREMEIAWHEIKRHPAVTLTLDIFFKGIVFFRKDFHEKQHFILRF